MSETNIDYSKKIIDFIEITTPYGTLSDVWHVIMYENYSGYPFNLYIKFGIGRATSDSAHEIRDNKITREEGVKLVKKYDGELSKRYFQITLDYMGITESEFWSVVDSWRSPHIWEKNSKGWKLLHTVWNNE